MRRNLSVRTAESYLPLPETRLKVIRDLRRLGFEVFDGSSPVVTARGPVRLFTEVFGGRFVKRIRTRKIPGSKRPSQAISIELREGSALPNSRVIQDVLLVAVATRPKPAVPSLPPLVNSLALHLPGDIAQLTRASATHRRSNSNGDRATGNGVTVAVLDSGFADHPYYREHDYRITRLSASDVASDPEVSDPALDEEDHGTYMIAGVLACAPDAHVLAIKYGNPLNALSEAKDRGANVISLSWGNKLAGNLTQLPTSDDSILLAQEILRMVANGITVVAAAGNLGDLLLPAMMPDVIAVGGVAVGGNDKLTAWNGASSFKSKIFKGRSVPDLCGIASTAMVPLPIDAYPSGWEALSGATSFATGQVAGIAALLLQKCPTLTPQEVRDHLTATATDVKSGKSFMKNKAKKGRDLATGFGLVNALDAWNSIP